MNLIPFTELTTFSKVFAESGIFADVKNAAQALVKIQAGQEMGIPPFAAMSGVHLIQGKAIVGAGLLAARVQGSGKYKYRVTEHNDKVCSVTFYEGGETLGISTFTIEDAKRAGTKNVDKFPRNMLFARAMSNGVKWFTPDLFGGPVYVPGEIPDDDKFEDVQHEVVPDAPAESAQLSAPDPAVSLAACRTVADLQEWRLKDGATMTPEIKALFMKRYNRFNGQETAQDFAKEAAQKEETI